MLVSVCMRIFVCMCVYVFVTVTLQGQLGICKGMLGKTAIGRDDPLNLEQRLTLCYGDLSSYLAQHLCSAPATELAKLPHVAN